MIIFSVTLLAKKEMLEKNPPFLHSMIGVKDGEAVIKLFIQGGDKDEKQIKDAMEKAFSSHIQIDLFNIDKQSESISNEAEELQREEENCLDINISTKKQLYEAIENNKNYLYKKYSTIIGIGISNVRFNGKNFVTEPCIVLYCLDKHIVPFGERPLPLFVNGLPCDHRENIALRKHFFLFDRLLSDHNFEVKSWKKKDMPDTVILEKNPSIEDYIAGVKGIKRVLKVLMTGDDDEEKRVEHDLKKACIPLEGISIEIVNIDKNSGSTSKEENKIQREEENCPDLDESVKTKLEKFLEKKQNYLYKRYSNIIAIGISNVRSCGDLFLKGPCIVLYCLDKHIVPFGEGPLPTSIGEWHCDHREDFAMLEVSPLPCPSSDIHCLELGCSIGKDSNQGSGSSGFRVVQIRNGSRITGFLTAAHVAVEDLDRTNKKIGSPNLGNTIFHPSKQDGQTKSQEVGEVQEAYYGTYNDRFLDVAFVKDRCLKESMSSFYFNISFF